ncbi:MAG: hypothetical protein ACPGED_02860 [Flavobacteriales bacterium]
MKRLLIVALLSSIFAPAIAQLAAGEFNSQFIEANQLMEEKYWNKSIDIWKDLNAADSTNRNVAYKLGYCYLQTANDQDKALPYLKSAVQNKPAKKYDPFDPLETKAPVEAHYYLGHSYHLNYQMEEGIASYEYFISKISKKHYMNRLAHRQIEMCHNAIYQVANPQNYLISNVGDVINDQSNDYSPVISLDESTMFFTSRRIRGDSTNEFITDFDTGEHKEDIYVSYKDKDGKWQTPELLNINTDSHAATISTSPDGQTLYIYYDENGDGQIWKSVLVGETWSDPEKLGSDINSDAWETHVTVSADEKTLFYTSDREDGNGGRDIYRCVKLPTDEWSKSLNVGTIINSEWEEDSPFLSADGKTLYFASQGHNSMGGFDIFYSELGDDGEWGQPKNIGYPLNTVEDDVFFVPAANSKRAYYSSAKDNGFGLKDIYVIDMPDSPIKSDLAVLKGFIYPAEGFKLPEDLLVVVTNKNTEEVTEYKPRSRDGSYVTILNPCDNYQIDYYVNSDLYQTEYINVPCESSYSEINKEVFLLPVQLNADGEEVAVLEEIPNPVEVDPGTRGIIDPLGNKVAVGTTFIEGEAYFQRYFLYDFHEFGKEEKKFTEFADNIESVIKANGSVTLLVESSASYVPSSRFKNNVELTNYRNKTARGQLADELEARGYKEGTDFTFGDNRKLVQGPKYKNDAQKNKATYELYQYIKIWAW